MMEFTLTAVKYDGNLEELTQPEFVGDGLKSLEDAIEAAKDAFEYAFEYSDGIKEVNVFADGVYVGYVNNSYKFIRDCDCELDLD